MRGLVVLVVLVVPLLAAASACGAAAQGPPQGEIVFTRQINHGQPDLYRMGTDGSHVRLLVTNAAYAAVSPDGSRIAFCRDHAIWVVRRDGSVARQLTHPLSKDTNDCDPAWSADGSSLYFTRQKHFTRRLIEPSADIYLISAQGGHARRVTDSSGCPSEPAVSPDGRLIAYVDTGLEDCNLGVDEIALMTTAGREASMPFRVLVSYSERYGVFRSQFDPAWSPDGKRLAWVVAGLFASAMDGIWIASVDGSAPQRVTPGSAPAWSPDGKWIAFGCGDISLVRADGAGLHRLAATRGIECAPSWLPPAN
jgi:Tol biopolymer transport system component